MSIRRRDRLFKFSLRVRKYERIAYKTLCIGIIPINISMPINIFLFKIYFSIFIDTNVFVVFYNKFCKMIFWISILSRMSSYYYKICFSIPIYILNKIMTTIIENSSTLVIMERIRLVRNFNIIFFFKLCTCWEVKFPIICTYSCRN